MSNRPRVLVVSYDDVIARGLHIVPDSAEPRQGSNDIPADHDLIVLDSGGAVVGECSRFRRRGALGSLLAILPQDDVVLHVAALDAGADDLLARPFAEREFVARAHAPRR
jgi:DNA-binding response OmpR family regulator